MGNCVVNKSSKNKSRSFTVSQFQGSSQNQTNIQAYNKRKISNINKLNIQMPDDKQISISIGSLNFGSIYSPFQYRREFKEELFGKIWMDIFNKIYDQQIEKNEVIFEKYIEINRMNQQLCIQCDDKYRKFRYSPLYSAKVGLDRNKFLVDKNQFKSYWKQYLQLAIAQQIFKMKPMHEKYTDPFKKLKRNDLIGLQGLWKYDWACYCFILLYTYQQQLPDNIKLIEQSEQREKILNKIIEEHNSQNYCHFIKSHLEDNLVDEDYKALQLRAYLQISQLDILFLQGVSSSDLQVLYRRINGYRIAASQQTSSVILIHDKTFKKVAPWSKEQPLDAYNYHHIDFLSHKKQLNLNQLPLSKIILKNIDYQSRVQSESKFDFQKTAPIRITLQKQNIIKKFQQTYQESETQLSQSLKKGMKSWKNNIFCSQNSSQRDFSSDFMSEIQNDLSKSLVQVLKQKKQVCKSLKKIHSKIVPQNLYNDVLRLTDTYFQFFDRFILISCRNFCSEMQYSKIEKILLELKANFEQYHIIASISSLKQLQISKQFHSFPSNKRNHSKNIYKQQTFLNVCHTNSTLPHTNICDYLISTIKLSDCSIRNIKNKKINLNNEHNKLIPNKKEHPFEFYIIQCKFTYRRPQFSNQQFHRRLFPNSKNYK